MCPKIRNRRYIKGRSLRHQRGLGLVAAIFVITIMALIAVGLSNLVLTSQQSYSHELLSTRAFFAAESGAQLAAHQVFPPEATGSCATASWAMPSSCQVETNCDSVTVASVAYYSIRSVGTCGDGADSAIRQLTIRMQDGTH